MPLKAIFFSSGAEINGAWDFPPQHKKALTNIEDDCFVLAEGAKPRFFIDTDGVIYRYGIRAIEPVLDRDACSGVLQGLDESSACEVAKFGFAPDLFSPSASRAIVTERINHAGESNPFDLNLRKFFDFDGWVQANADRIAAEVKPSPQEWLKARREVARLDENLANVNKHLRELETKLGTVTQEIESLILGYPDFEKSASWIWILEKNISGQIVRVRKDDGVWGAADGGDTTAQKIVELAGQFWEIQASKKEALRHQSEYTDGISASYVRELASPEYALNRAKELINNLCETQHGNCQSELSQLTFDQAVELSSVLTKLQIESFTEEELETLRSFGQQAQEIFESIDQAETIS